MMISDLYSETMSSITANKARSGLTILGIVIGIASVIAMVAIGQGTKDSVESSIQSIGSNLLMVSPGAARTGRVSGGWGSAQTLTLDDAEALEDISTVENVAPDVSSRYQVTAKSNNTNTQVIGTLPSYLEVKNFTVESGNFFSDTDNKNLSKVAVIGPTTRDDLFGEGVDPIGETIRINQLNFKVIGVTASKGNSDDMILIPLNTDQKYLSGNKYVSTINIQATSADVLDATEEEVSSILLSRHKISDPSLADFRITNMGDIVETASSVTGTFTTLLAAIAGISLLVGGIGIMNMMLTTVTERTREIGLRKSIGAKKSEISQQFLMESITLTVIGGILGVLLGWLIALAITHFSGTATRVSISSILLAFGVSAGIGIVFGYYPASRAAKLNPIDALRYE